MTSMARTEIIVDHRESKSGVCEYLSALADVRLRWENLSTGDYIVEQLGIFERKTASDFAASLIDQRLFSQAKRLADLPLRAAFIIEGSSSEWGNLRVRREAPTRSLDSALHDFRSFRFPFARSKRDGSTPSICWQPIRETARGPATLSNLQGEKKMDPTSPRDSDAARGRSGSGLSLARSFRQCRGLHYRNRLRTGKSARYRPKDSGCNT